MVGCQKSKCSSSWPPIITFTRIANIHTFIQTFTPHRHTVYQQHKQVNRPNNCYYASSDSCDEVPSTSVSTSSN